ncbi:hypothetical protein GGR50DRAFT_665083 [Xylaria sp. CBS 124048]|nr:hypothetical protein GGR50DRAFT_665083 [Xylaria sp. CBS 124048]
MVYEKHKPDLRNAHNNLHKMSSQTVHLKATYTSPNTSHQPQILASTPLTLPLSISASNPTSTPSRDVSKSKTTYLNSLRTATVALQERINAELTARMEEDNAGARGVDEVAEEENYGEEAQEDEV